MTDEVIDKAGAILATWQSSSSMSGELLIIPDGCRDLIVSMQPGKVSDWSISALQNETKKISMTAGVLMYGFRLKPGVEINQHALLAVVQSDRPDEQSLQCKINDFTFLRSTVEEALACLASDVRSIAQCAKSLGVSQRTLQRLSLRHTGRPPTFWLQLARVRKAARRITEPLSLAELAVSSGYSDQAHMTRDFKHWLRCSPAKLNAESEQYDQLLAKGYG